MFNENRLYEVDEVAEIFRFHPQTIYKMLRSGELKGWKRGEKGTWKVSGKAINELINSWR